MLGMFDHSRILRAGQWSPCDDDNDGSQPPDGGQANGPSECYRGLILFLWPPQKKWGQCESDDNDVDRYWQYSWTLFWTIDEKSRQHDTFLMVNTKIRSILGTMSWRIRCSGFQECVFYSSTGGLISPNLCHESKLFRCCGISCVIQLTCISLEPAVFCSVVARRKPVSVKKCHILHLIEAQCPSEWGFKSEDHQWCRL